MSPDGVTISIIDCNTKLGHNYIMERDDSEAPKLLFEESTRKKKTQIKFVCSKHNGRALFLSSVKKKIATKLGFQSGDEFHAWHMVESSEEWSERAKPKLSVKMANTTTIHPKIERKQKERMGTLNESQPMLRST